MNCTSTSPQRWETIDWPKVNLEVKRLQSRIFVAKQEGKRRQLRRLQKLLFNSRSNRLVALRRVIVLNEEQNTSGIDRVVISKAQRMDMLNLLATMDYYHYQPLPVRRVSNPKSGGRSFVPTILDRCVQAMVKNCLEPEWEAVFEATSYGFRPGRSTHDAISRIYNTLSVKKRGKNKKNWILSADIEGFFNNVCHEEILQKLDNFPAKHLITKWLKAGYLEENRVYRTDKGTHQEGVISPLLANIAVCDLEKFLKTAPDNSGRVRGSRVYVRYADHFVVLCSSLQEARKTQIEIATWLKSKGLTIATNKTRVVHVSEGFDFLGVNVRQFKTNAKTKKNILLIQPSNNSIKQIKHRLKQEWHFLRGKSIKTVLNRLNPIILGWRRYFRKYVATKAFRKLDDWMYLKCRNYAYRMHSNKGKWWIYDKYFGNFVPSRKDKWVFGNKQSGQYLHKFAWANIRRHTLVKGYNSPYDPTLDTFWENRNRVSFKETNSASSIKMAQRQKFLCPVCKKSLYGEQNLAIHHLIPQKLVVIDAYWNLILVHHQCHQILHSNAELNQNIFKEFLPEPERMIKQNTKTSWRRAILSYVDNPGKGF